MVNIEQKALDWNGPRNGLWRLPFPGNVALNGFLLPLWVTCGSTGRIMESVTTLEWLWR